MATTARHNRSYISQGLLSWKSLLWPQLQDTFNRLYCMRSHRQNQKLISKIKILRLDSTLKEFKDHLQRNHSTPNDPYLQQELKTCNLKALLHANCMISAFIYLSHLKCLATFVTLLCVITVWQAISAPLRREENWVCENSPLRWGDGIQDPSSSQ